MSESKVIECGLIAENENVIARFKELCEEFAYGFQVWPDLDSFMDEGVSCRMVAFYLQPMESTKEFSQKATEIAQGISYVCDTAYRFAIFEKLLPKEETIFLKKSGVHCIMSRPDLEDTSKLEFFASQMIRAEYVAIKEMDLLPDIEVGFDIYHLMPLSGKFLKIVRAGNAFDDRKKARMKEVGEFYVHRKELPLFTQYAREFSDTSDGGLMRVCRAQFLEFQSKFGELGMMLTDESETMSFDEGKALLDSCNELAQKLAESLSKIGVGGMFDVVNNSSVGEFGSIERAPAVAAYAAFFSMGLKFEKLSEIIFGALIMDLGLIFLSGKSSKKIRENRISDFDEEEMSIYKRFPQKSIDVILNRRLPLDEEFKKSVLRAREQADGKGFPKGFDGDKLTDESQVLGFSSFFDQTTLLSMGQERKDPKVALQEIIEHQLTHSERFNAMFMVALKKAFGEQNSAGEAA